MKRALALILALLLIGSAVSAIAEDIEWETFPVGGFSVSVPAEWTTTYNSPISILSYKENSPGYYSDMLTAVTSTSLVEGEEEFNAYCDLIYEQMEFDVDGTEDITMNGEPARLWYGRKANYDATGIIYCHGSATIIVVHIKYDTPLEERLDFMRDFASRITPAE